MASIPTESEKGTPAASPPSVTTLVSRNAQWLRRFFLIFGVLLVAAIAFNIYLTRRLDAEAAAGAPEPYASGAPSVGQAPPPQGSAVRMAGSAAAVTTATGLSAGEPVAARLSGGAEPSSQNPPPIRPSRPAAATPAGAAPGPESERPADRTRPRASGEGKKALDQARAAFERDDFSRAILQGRAALAAGEGGAHAILGAAYFKVGRFEDSAREYGEALRWEPGNPALARRVEIARRAAARHAEGAPP